MTVDGRFEPQAYCQTDVGNFEIPRSLAKASHSFTVDNTDFTIQLPDFDVDNEFKLTGAQAHHVELSSYTPALGRDSAFINVKRITILAEVSEELISPPGVFEQQANAPGLFSLSEQTRNSRLVEKYARLMYGSFQYWKRVARWVTNSWLLAEASAEAKSLGPQVNFARINDKASGRPFWVSGGIVQLNGRSKVSEVDWARIGLAVAAQAEPPVWISFYNDAVERLNVDDVFGCIASCVIAAETVAREAYHVAAGRPQNSAAVDLMQRVAATTVIDKWKLLTNLPTMPPGASDMKKLLQVRNSLFHLGDQTGIGPGAARRYLTSCGDFVLAVDAWIIAETCETRF